jgi:sugar lactone lactonase YvrE
VLTRAAQHRQRARVRLGPALIACALALTVGVPPANAAPDCNPLPQPNQILSGLGRLESIAADRQGRLYFVETGTTGRLLRLSARDAQPEVLVAGIANPRGHAFDRNGTLYLGFGGDGVVSSVVPSAGLLRIDPRTGAHSVYTSGLEMANGVAWAPDGVIYASNNFGTHIHRVVDGRAENKWAAVTSANGLVVDRAGDFLYAAQTFQPAAIKRVEIANPENVETWVQAAPEDTAAGPDGITRDEQDQLYVAANAAGQVWRVDSQRRICALWRGTPVGPSAVSFGGGDGPFPKTSLYLVTFQGQLIELPGTRG